MKIAIWDPQNIGDHILATPAIRTYAQKFSTKIDILYDPKPHRHLGSRNFLETNPYVGQQIITNHWDITPQLIKEYNRYDKILRSHYGGFKERNEHILKVTCDNFEHQWPEIKIEDRIIDVFLTEEDEIFGQHFKDSIVLTPFGSHLPWNRSWPVDNWNRLIFLLNEKGYRVCQIGTLADLVFYGVIDLRGKTTIRQACAILKYCKLHIAISTFTEIITSHFNTPAMILHGYLSPTIIGYDNNINLTAGVKCSPCWDLTPCKDLRCMNNITVDTVFSTALGVVKSGNR